MPQAIDIVSLAAGIIMEMPEDQSGVREAKTHAKEALERAARVKRGR
jgi:hypothetical protein